MPQIPFLSINIVAFCFALILFVSAVSSRKSKVIWVFIAVLADFVIWSGASILMRLRLWPGLEFWFYVSLVALLLIALLFYWFVHTFYHEKRKGGLIVSLVLTSMILPGAVTGFFLDPPKAVARANGGVVFIYSTKPAVLIPCFVCAFIILLASFLLYKLVKIHGIHSPGLMVIIWGGILMLAGNILQVCLPGNVFPYDALSGILFILMLMFALYRKRLFRMELLISKTILCVILAIICLFMSLYLVTPFHSFALGSLKVSQNCAIILSAILFGMVLVVVYGILRKLLDNLFVGEKQQGMEVQSFTSEVSHTLNTVEIMEKLSQNIKGEMKADRVFVCLFEEGKYVSRYCSSPLAINSFYIDESSPHVSYLREYENYLILREFESNPMFLSAWESEKRLFRNLKVRTMAALKDGDDVIGLVLLSYDEEIVEYRYDQVTYLETICSVTSIAMKNARLYEKMFREARVDTLTGAFNYRYFNGKVVELYDECAGDSIALLYIDIDDFKLYNQLYGVEEGDCALKLICESITQCVGDSGYVFRTSGKVFAVLLPHQDVHHGCAVAEEIRLRVKAVNQKPGRESLKDLSVSIGICVAPYSASSVKELMENADLAVYYAKQSGKDCTNVFRSSVAALPKKITEKTERIINETLGSSTAEKYTISMISALTAAIDAKDHYTYFHSKNVAYYASCLGVAMGLNDEEIKTIYVAGLLHDIGKISIPETILNKTGKLTDEEYDLMKAHVNNSIEMIRYLPEMDYIVPAVLGHHERYDGKGYPGGVSGEEIPVTARCLAVADAFDAMTTDRPYRKGLSVEYSIQQLIQGAGTQFDPKLAALFAELLENKEIVLNRKAQEGMKKDRLY